MSEPRRIAVFGDLSGHLGPLLDELRGLGVEFSGTHQLPTSVSHWPTDLHVVQVGDLVHKGPDSMSIVAVVHDLLLPTGRWTQLLGNHEAQYVGGPHFWTPVLPAPAIEALQTLYYEGRLAAACALDTEQLGPVLVVHGGLTPPRFDALASRLALPDRASPDAAAHVAAWLNTAPDDPQAARYVFTPGIMLGASSTDPGVCWAEARRELRLPWRRWQADGRVLDDEPTRHLPFSQVHGHSTPLIVSRGRPPRVPADLAGFTTHDRATRHVTSTYDVAGVPRRIVGVDPGANARSRVAPRPLLLRGRVLG